jgi:hypothetical protein
MNELMYSQSSLAIVAGLLVVMLLATEAGYRAGRRRAGVASDAIRSQANTVLAAMLGLLALLFGFTYSLALQRYEDRSQAIVAEANAIGTAWLRSQLLPAGVSGEAQSTLRKYIDLRVREGRITLDAASERSALIRQGNAVGMQLWDLAAKAAATDDRPVTSGLFIQAVNDALDAAERRRAAFERHVPESVLYLVFLTFLMAAVTLGYASGAAHHRVTMPGITLVILIALVAYLIIDLDRPRRGMIQVSHDSLIELQRGMAEKPRP